MGSVEVNNFSANHELLLRTLQELNLDNSLLSVRPKSRELIKTASLPEQYQPALRFAAIAHANQDRKDGEPYLTHPIELTHLAQAIFLLKPQMELFQALILHDAPEDIAKNFEKSLQNFDPEKKLTPEEKQLLQQSVMQLIIEKFGQSVARLVEGVTKITQHGDYDRHKLIELTHRKITSASNYDAQVGLIKLIDRFHNMSTLKHLSREQQIRISDETLNFYVDMAAHFNLIFISRELANWSFRYLEPEKYQEIAQHRESQQTELKSKNNMIEHMIHQAISMGKHGLASTTLVKSYSTIYEDYNLWLENLRQGDTTKDNIVLHQNSSYFYLIVDQSHPQSQKILHNFDRNLASLFPTYAREVKPIIHVYDQQFSGLKIIFHHPHSSNQDFTIEILTRGAYEANYLGASLLENSNNFKCVCDSDKRIHFLSSKDTVED
ncbi:MAG: bifunctional (p)ppGpp synthetase/guanosine-3',5'-bis(diphosphate) 3'-pyrophosphohydrolase, partial [Candidatus Moranbacteria bacterium]|nr:bifunctional (p)ppGpp synthetase/guanosine-3',5'-bis(diphosphate) 3'-pyrophosphohydrolase [Candidatus Moranbacteria bacterium]